MDRAFLVTCCSIWNGNISAVWNSLFKTEELCKEYAKGVATDEGYEYIEDLWTDWTDLDKDTTVNNLTLNSTEFGIKKSINISISNELIKESLLR